MDNSLKNQIVVITGGGGGIGRATAVKLASCGAKIVLLGGNNREKLQTSAELVKTYSECLTLPGNLTDIEFIRSGVKEIIRITGGIDVLVNNAGVAQNQAFEDITVDDFDRIMAINVRAPFMLIQEALPFLKKSSSPAIVNIASVVAHAGYPQQSIYTASKHALLGMTKSLAAEYYQENIRVHAISPGGVYTDMVKVSRPDLSPDGMILPEDVANTIHFLLTCRTNAVIDEILMHRVGKTPFLV